MGLLENITTVEMTWETLPEFCLRVLKRWQMTHGKYKVCYQTNVFSFYVRFPNQLFLWATSILQKPQDRYSSQKSWPLYLGKVVKHLSWSELDINLCQHLFFLPGFWKSLENTEFCGDQIVSTLDSRLSTVWVWQWWSWLQIYFMKVSVL